MVFVEGNVLLLALEVHGLGSQRSCTLGIDFIDLVLLQLLSCHFSDDLELLLLLELYNPLFDLVVARLLVELPALLHCLADLVESADDVLRYFELEFVDVLILDVFDGCPDEVLVHTFAEERTGFENEAHLLLSEELSCRVILIQ
jgi:hypothetical protein